MSNQPIIQDLNKKLKKLKKKKVDILNKELKNKIKIKKGRDGRANYYKKINFGFSEGVPIYHSKIE